MSRTVHCAKHGVDAAALAFAPWPGALGKRIFESIGQPAWQEWLAHQTMLINENRLSPMDPKHRALRAAQRLTRTPDADQDSRSTTSTVARRAAFSLSRSAATSMGRIERIRQLPSRVWTRSKSA